jgi:twitching motility protein PilT
MSSEDTLSLVHELIDTKHSELYTLGGDVDAAYTDEFNNRYRLNVYRQRGVPAIAIRLLRNTIPTLKELKMPDVLSKLAMLPRGLVLVTGPTGSGKSTTLAAMIDHINRNRHVHILTLEDPIEYIHTANKGMIHQREIHTDANDFASALRSALREDPDVILVGEMRDHETIALALTAAETGHLVLSTLHTTGAANTIDRIIDVFPPHQQGQIRTQLASSLQAVISQDLLPLEGGLGRIAAHEILLMTDAVANLIRENKIVQINSAIQTGMKLGMCTLDGSLVNLIRKNLISLDTAMENTSNPEALKRLLQNF